MMSKRTTIVIDDELLRKLRQIQSKLIKLSSNNVSFSSVVNEQLRKTLK